MRFIYLLYSLAGCLKIEFGLSTIGNLSLCHFFITIMWIIYERGFLTDKNFKFELVGVSFFDKRKPQSVSPPIGI